MLAGQAGERFGDDARLLGGVDIGQTLRRAGVLGSSDVAERQMWRQQRGEMWRNVAPRAHVARLLLQPDDLAQMWVAGDDTGHLLLREWIQLLDTSDRQRLGLLG